MEKIYRHFKGGYYRFITEVTNSETQEKEVVYQALYGEHKVWTRPADMFYGNVNVDGVEIDRFTEVVGIPVFHTEERGRNVKHLEISTALLRFSICKATPRPYFHTLGAISSSETA